MEFDAFKASLADDRPPDGISEPLIALWYDGRGNWEVAHSIAQEIETSIGSLIHAYLHRKEGDIGNARYWYSQAKEAMPCCPLAEEWEGLVCRLLR